MAKRRRKTSRSKQAYPAWLWMIFGLAIGLSVAAAVYFSDRPVRTVVEKPAEPPPARPLDDNGETVVSDVEEKPRFDFYELLKKMEVEIEDATPSPTRSTPPQAVVQEGTYILQAGSFTRAEDAEKRRVELALQGIESRVVAARVNGTTRHRVYIGPTSDLDKLNLLRSQLRAAKIDVLRITVNE